MLARRIATPLALLLLAACGNSSQDSTGTQQSRQLSVGVTAAAPVAADYYRVVQQIYVGYFGRPADVGGLDWHAKVLLAAGAPTDIAGIARAYDSNAALRAEIDSFGTSAESAALYPGDNGQFIDALYRNLFGRAADEGGKAFWANALDQKLMTRASAAIQLMSGAGGADVTIIGNKTSVASAFTAQIVTPILAQGYTGLASDAVVRTMLGQVGATTDLAAFNGTIRSTLTSLAGSVAAANGWDIVPAAPAMNSAAPKAPVVLATQVVARPPAVPAAPPVPATLAAAPGGSNLKLWLYDPRSTGSVALATGIFLRNVTANGAWSFVGANADGSLYQQLAAATSYEFDTVEPNGTATTLQRHRYQVSVSATGAVSLKDQNANANGIYAVTLDMAPTVSPQVQKLQDALRALAAQPVSAFKPTSQCQLVDAVTPQRAFHTDLSAGFPKVRTRLPSFGHVRSLIIPVDFPEVAGTDDPGSFFTPLANEVRDFYHKQSYGRLAFDFDILPNWVRLPFNPSKYGFTSVNGSGDFTSYRNDIFAMLDGQVDFSKYDAVYILVPKQMPMSKMGYGPAITGPTWTSTGYVINGATGGADMYLTPGNEWRWMAHETGHAFGLYDEDLDHKTQTLGHWGVMAMNWSRNAIENVSWDRYLMGWLPEEQVACLPKAGLDATGTSVTLGPLVRQSADTKAAMVPLSSTKILVMESRKSEGYDRIAAGNEGVLVYTVDMTVGTLKGGYRTVRRSGSVDPNFEDAALRAGDSVTVEGVTVTVTASGKDGDTVKLSRH
ncbi:DUF4214 domain-containing protein [Massilia yuzhufengensis]|uniref:M6 family metalloprotease domain-containing protein n=1 Tax=Massilia yuzhufengensis TaxID=1164594 RepID=A0A1I1K7Q9_9BURK|nr:DUF4214 domain-containing protein [Massilia yuzhufengensis]SFC56561.1 M6 family metalloprotease domain-containing protein [Massilia yuzhufengensis]